MATAAARLLSKGAIAGIVIGVFFGVLIIVVIMAVTFGILRRRRTLQVGQDAAFLWPDHAHGRVATLSPPLC